MWTEVSPTAFASAMFSLTAVCWLEISKLIDILFSGISVARLAMNVSLTCCISVVH